MFCIAKPWLRLLIHWSLLSALQGHAGHKHLNVNKSMTQKNRLAQTAYSNHSQTVRLKKLLPYGSP